MSLIKGAFNGLVGLVVMGMVASPGLLLIYVMWLFWS